MNLVRAHLAELPLQLLQGSLILGLGADPALVERGGAEPLRLEDAW